jgi:hypothetical protein
MIVDGVDVNYRKYCKRSIISNLNGQTHVQDETGRNGLFAIHLVAADTTLEYCEWA